MFVKNNLVNRGYCLFQSCLNRFSLPCGRFSPKHEILHFPLRKADANVIGAVMNYCETETSEYYYAYYNKEGKRVKEHDAAAEVAASPAVMPSKRGASSHAAMGPSDTF